MLNKIDEEAKNFINEKEELIKENKKIVSSIPVADIVNDIRSTLKEDNNYYQDFNQKIAMDSVVDDRILIKDEVIDEPKSEKKISFFERLLNVL